MQQAQQYQQRGAAVRFRREWFNPLYFILNRILQDDRIRIILVFGGKSAAKTASISQLLAKEAFVKKASAIAFRKESAIIKTTLKPSFKLALKTLWLKSAFETLDFSFRCTNEAEIVLKGIDSEEKAKGVEGFKYLYLDELNQFDPKEFEQFNLSLRGIPGQRLFASWNPVSERSWVKTDLVDTYEWEDTDAYGTLPSPDSFVQISNDGSAILIKTTYLDNYFIVGSPCGTYGYRDENLIAEYEKQRFRDYNSYRVNVLGQWGIPENKAPWLYAFDREKHVRSTLPFYPSYDVHLAFDFNRDPVSCVAVQYSPNLGTPNSFIHFIKEFGGKMQLEELCSQIKTFFPNSIFRVTGDSSGNKGDVAYKSAHDTAYTLIRGYLNLSRAQMQPNISNLLHENSRYLCNAMFANHPNVFISEAGCPNLIADCEMAQTDEKAGKPHQLRKDREAFKMDYFDGMRYFFQRYTYDFAKLAYLRVHNAN